MCPKISAIFAHLLKFLIIIIIMIIMISLVFCMQDEFCLSLGLDKFKKGWFCELGIISGDLAKCIKIKKILYQGKSKYQDILIFERWVYIYVYIFFFSKMLDD